jgi:hypothetical protein
MHPYNAFPTTSEINAITTPVPQTVAMAISGHKTISVFQRYDIGNEADLLEASNPVAAYRRDKSAISAGG